MAKFQRRPSETAGNFSHFRVVWGRRHLGKIASVRRTAMEPARLDTLGHILAHTTDCRVGQEAVIRARLLDVPTTLTSTR